MITKYYNRPNYYFIFDFPPNLKFNDVVEYATYLNSLSIYISFLTLHIKDNSKEVLNIKHHLTTRTPYKSINHYLTSLRHHREKCLNKLREYVNTIEYLRLGMRKELSVEYITPDFINTSSLEEEGVKLPCTEIEIKSTIARINSLYKQINKCGELNTIFILPPPFTPCKRGKDLVYAGVNLSNYVSLITMNPIQCCDISVVGNFYDKKESIPNIEELKRKVLDHFSPDMIKGIGRLIINISNTRQ